MPETITSRNFALCKDRGLLFTRYMEQSAAKTYAIAPVMEVAKLGLLTRVLYTFSDCQPYRSTQSETEPEGQPHHRRAGEAPPAAASAKGIRWLTLPVGRDPLTAPVGKRQQRQLARRAAGAVWFGRNLSWVRLSYISADAPGGAGFAS